MRFEDYSWAEILAAGTVAGFVIKFMSYLARRIFTFAVIVNSMERLHSSFEEHKNETTMRLNKQDKTLDDQSKILNTQAYNIEKILKIVDSRKVSRE
jgi:hypothetical protein